MQMFSKIFRFIALVYGFSNLISRYQKSILTCKVGPIFEQYAAGLELLFLKIPYTKAIVLKIFWTFPMAWFPRSLIFLKNPYTNLWKILAFLKNPYTKAMKLKWQYLYLLFGVYWIIQRNINMQSRTTYLHIFYVKHQ